MGFIYKTSKQKTYYLNWGKVKFLDGEIDNAWFSQLIRGQRLLVIYPMAIEFKKLQRVSLSLEK